MRSNVAGIFVKTITKLEVVMKKLFLGSLLCASVIFSGIAFGMKSKEDSFKEFLVLVKPSLGEPFPVNFTSLEDLKNKIAASLEKYDKEFYMDLVFHCGDTYYSFKEVADNPRIIKELESCCSDSTLNEAEKILDFGIPCTIKRQITKDKFANGEILYPIDLEGGSIFLGLGYPSFPQRQVKIPYVEVVLRDEGGTHCCCRLIPNLIPDEEGSLRYFCKKAMNNWPIEYRLSKEKKKNEFPFGRVRDGLTLI